MEYVEGKDLQKHLIENGGILCEDEARILFQQLLVAVSKSCEPKQVLYLVYSFL